MSFGLRTWLFAITILLVAEDFQYVLKIGDNPLLEKKEICKDCDQEDSENEGNQKEEKEEKKDEKKEKDENKNDNPDALLNAHSELSKNKFRDAFHLLSDVARELESPPPEV